MMARKGNRASWTHSLVLAAAAGLALPTCSAEDDGPTRVATDWNLVLISMDTLRPDRLSLYGEIERETSPVIDEIFSDSVVFGDCWAQATATGPSHRSMLTGMYVHRHGMLANRQMISSPFTLAGLLKEAGWNTGAFTGGGTTREKFGLTGFDAYESSGGPNKPRARSFARTWPMAEEWLDEVLAKENDKFFLFLHSYDPHCPYWPPEETRDYASWYQGEFDPQDKCGHDDFSPLIQDGGMSEDDFRYLNDLYDGGVTWGDLQLKGLFDYLKEKGEFDNTLIVFTSDHGESLGEHDYVGHSRMWIEQIRVPLMIRFPNGEWAGRIDDPMESVDIVPTVLDFLGVDEPEGVNGLSLMARIRGEAEPAGREIRVCKYGTYESVLLDDRWKLNFIRESTEPSEIGLYDLQNDPGELNNLVETDEGRRQFDELFARYRAWRQESASTDKKYRGVKIGELSAADENEMAQLGYAEEAEMDLENALDE